MRIAQLFAAMFVTASFVLASPSLEAQETGSKTLDEARTAVNRSTLTADAKTAVLAKADHAVAAGVPAEDVSLIITRSLNRGVESRQLESYLDTATRTREQKLPVRLVLDRIEQGLAKGVPAEKISLVTERLSGHVAAARPIVNKVENLGVKSAGGSNSDSVETVARALEKSVPRDAIMKTGEKVKDRKESMVLFNRAVDTMTVLAGNGMPADEAGKMVGRAIDKGYSERDMEGMERYMADEMRKNRSMKEIVSGMNSRMESGEMMRGMQGMSGAGSMNGPGSGGMGGMGGMSGMGGRR